jgi:hypothetical protein
MREVAAQLPPAWVTRPVHVDYGIDLEVEPFETGHSRGDLLMLQVKGTDKALRTDAPWPFSMPVNGLKYALRFVVPVLLVVQPVARGRPGRFLWLQEYVSVVLDPTKPSWRTRKTVTVKIPAHNALASNLPRLLHIAAAPRRTEDLGQLARLAHEVGHHYARWTMLGREDDLRVVRALLDEVVGLDSLFGDSGWAWGRSIRVLPIEPAIRKVNMLLDGHEIDVNELPGVNVQYLRSADDPQQVLRNLLQADLELLGNQLSAIVATAFDRKLKQTLWLTSGDHDF